MSISKGAISAWRELIRDTEMAGETDLIVSSGSMGRILDSLEAAEARAEKAENDATVKKYELAHKGTWAKLLEAEARAEAAERERDALAQTLAWGAGKDKKPLFQNLPWMDAKQKWLEWARQQARGGENE